MAVLEESDVVSSYGLDQVLRSRQLTKGNLEVVGIIQGVQQVFVERVDVLQTREAVENGVDLLGEGL